MNDPPRLLDSGKHQLGARLLRAADLDKAPRGALTRALQTASAAGVIAAAGGASAAGAGTTGAGAAGAGAAGAGAAGAGAAGAGAAATAGTSIIKAVAVWVTIGGASGAVATGVVHSISEPEPPRVTAVVPQPRDAARIPARVTNDQPPAQLAPPPAEPVRPEPAQSEPLRPEPAQSEPMGPEPPRSAGSVAQRRAIVAPALAANPRPPTTSRPEFGEELALIDRARSELAAGNAQGALDSARAYRTRFGGGYFQSEMMALEIEALAARGERARARELAQSFLSRHGNHPLADRVRKATDAE